MHWSGLFIVAEVVCGGVSDRKTISERCDWLAHDGTYMVSIIDNKMGYAEILLHFCVLFRKKACILRIS